MPETATWSRLTEPRLLFLAICGFGSYKVFASLLELVSCPEATGLSSFKAFLALDELPRPTKFHAHQGLKQPLDAT